MISRQLAVCDQELLDNMFSSVLPHVQYFRHAWRKEFSRVCVAAPIKQINIISRPMLAIAAIVVLVVLVLVVVVVVLATAAVQKLS